MTMTSGHGNAPGDIIIAHPSVLHGDDPRHHQEEEELSRSEFIATICYATRPNETNRTSDTGPSLSLKEGDPLRSPWYPRVRPIPDHLKSEWL